MFNRHPLAWFESRVDQVVYRNDRPFHINNKKDAEYCPHTSGKGLQIYSTPSISKAKGTRPT